MKVLIFDLDDTLMDTYGQLIQVAYHEACSAMVAAGLDMDVSTCLQKREDYFYQYPRENVFEKLADGDPKLTAVGETAFFAREVEKDIDLFAGVRAMLGLLKNSYSLYLVTSGTQATQKQKVEILNIAPLFKKIFYVDPKKGETKKTAFQSIVSDCNLSANECLSIGNRLDNEIREAKEIGMNTCYLKYGEYAHLKPADQYEQPDYILYQITDLVKVCDL